MSYAYLLDEVDDLRAKLAAAEQELEAVRWSYARSEKRVRELEESLNLCLVERSPLPPILKDVVRGFFVTPIANKKGTDK